MVGTVPGPVDPRQVATSTFSPLALDMRIKLPVHFRRRHWYWSPWTPCGATLASPREIVVTWCVLGLSLPMLTVQRKSSWPCGRNQLPLRDYEHACVHCTLFSHTEKHLKYTYWRYKGAKRLSRCPSVSCIKKKKLSPCFFAIDIASSYPLSPLVYKNMQSMPQTLTCTHMT